VNHHVFEAEGMGRVIAQVTVETGAVPGCAPPHLDAQVEKLWAGVALAFYMGEGGSKFSWGGLHVQA
jgi:hypothetical protein